MESLRLENIGKVYTRGKVAVPVLREVGLSIARGEFVALMGASGSGKTTLINILGSLDQPTEGRYWLDGQEVSRLAEDARAALRNGKIGFVFQNFNLLPRLSALENVMVPMAYAVGGPSERACLARARGLLERVGLGDRVDHEPARLSGGEQQRVAIARSLVNAPSLLIADEPTGNLDSQTGSEILEVFRRLNEEDGLTIILVTHDPGVASAASRTIRIKDGIVTDPGPAELTVIVPEDREPAAPSRRRRSLRPTIRATTSALRSLRRNALRSGLTTLGIIIGVASLIAIAEIGKGSSRAIRSMLTKTGVDNVLVQAGAASRNGVSLGSGSVKTLSFEDAEAIRRECPAVDSLAPIVYARQQVVRGNRNWVPAYLYGTTPGLLRVRDWEDLEEGEAFTDADVRDIAMVCLLGQTLVRELFGDESPIGREVYVNDVPLTVIGVLSRKGADIIGEDQDDVLLAPLTTVKYRVSAGATGGDSSSPGGVDLNDQLSNLQGRRYPRSRTSLYPVSSPIQRFDTPKLERLSNVDSILVRAHSTPEIPAAMTQIRELLRERHRTAVGEEDFAVRDFTEVVRAVQATVGVVAGLLLCVAFISLVVGGVGIMNVMLVSVTERYREIGLRMAVGARSRDILRQFLVEAVVLCILGGGVGIALGRGASVLVRVVAGWPTEASWLAVAASVSVAATVGVVFGYYPAWKASRLNPIEALRFE